MCRHPAKSFPCQSQKGEEIQYYWVSLRARVMEEDCPVEAVTVEKQSCCPINSPQSPPTFRFPAGAAHQSIPNFSQSLGRLLWQTADLSFLKSTGQSRVEWRLESGGGRVISTAHPFCHSASILGLCSIKKPSSSSRKFP